MRKFYTFLIALLTVCGLAQAQTVVTWVAGDQGYENAAEVSSIAFDNTITATLEKGTNKNTPKYYDTGKGVRLYGGNTITLSGAPILKVVVTYDGSQDKTVTSNPEGYEHTKTQGVWTGNAESITFTVDGTSGHIRIQKIEVTYGEAAPDYVATPVIKPTSGTYYTAQEVTITAGEGCTIYYTTDGVDPTVSSKEYTTPFTVTETTTVKAIAVKSNNISDVAESVITIETLQAQTIADVISGGAVDQASTTGTVVGVCKSGFLISDATGYIFVYTGSAPTVAVGDVVVVTGKVSAYGGCLQFSGATINQSGTAEVNYPQVAVIDGEAFDALVAAPAVTFVQVSGKMSSVGNYNNFTIEGAKAIGSIQTTADGMGDIAVNDEVTVTGFFVYQSSNNKYGNIIAVKIEKTGSAQTPEYNTIAAAKEAVTAAGEYIQLNLTECLVTFVNGQNLYLFDGNDGLLVFGANSGIKAGDKISGFIKGQITLYKGLTELKDPNYSVQVVSSENEVKPQNITLAEFENYKDYESELVTIEDLTPQAAALESKNLIFIDDSDNDITVRDNFNVLTDATFNTTAAYTVTGFVSIYEGDSGTTVQLYPRTAEDIVNPNEEVLQTPEAAWEPASVQVKMGETVTATFTTNSDGAISYESSNPAVATVDNQGNIAIVGAGSAKITATVEATNTFKSAVAVLEISVTSNDTDGSLAKPYTVADVKALSVATDAPKGWVRGYIVGYVSGGIKTGCKFTAEDAVETNILLAASASEKDYNNCIPVELQKQNGLRGALSLTSHADYLGKEVWIYGSLTPYFTVPGVKAVTNWSFDGVTEENKEEVLPVIAPATGTYEEAQQVTITVAEGYAIYYTLDGTDPTVETGTLYTEPFMVEETTTVKAIAAPVTGGDVSKVVTSVITISQGQEEGYTKIADIKAAATADKVAVTYNAQDVLVTYINGKNLYVFDGTDGLLLFGTNSGIAAGDRISVTVKGNLYLFNGLTEIADATYSDLVKVSEGNEVTAQEVLISELTQNFKAFENELVTIKDVTPAAEAWTKKNMTFTDDSDNEIVLRDNFSAATGVTFETSETYNITGFVAIYAKDEASTIQIYPRSENDIEKTSESELKVPEAAWTAERVQVTFGEAVEASFSTNSNGAVSYESSNTQVATVDEQGNISVVGVGVANITANVAQTTTFKSASAVLVVAVTSGADGSMANPYTIGDVQALCSDLASEKVWVMGYIIGSANNSFTVEKLVKVGGEGAAETNLVIADAAEESEIGNMIPVALPTGDVRAALNLKDNADLIGKQVWLYGKIEKYFSVAGVRSVSDFSFDGATGIKGIDAEKASDKVIYNLAGQRVQNLNKAGLYIVNGKKVVIK